MRNMLPVNFIFRMENSNNPDMKQLLTLLMLMAVFPFVCGQDSIPKEPKPGVVSAKIYTQFNYSLEQG